jgi:hypothetical protein
MTRRHVGHAASTPSLLALSSPSVSKPAPRALGPRNYERRFLIPGWIILPLVWLGLLYLTAPWWHDWYSYGFGLLVAISFGVWARMRYRVTVLHRSQGGVVVWLRCSKEEEPEIPVVVITDASGAEVEQGPAERVPAGT